MTGTNDIIERLQAWADMKIGDPAPNNWGVQLSADLRRAIAEIEYLRSELYGLSDE